MADIKADAPYIGEFGDYVRNSVSPSIGMAASQGWGYGCDKSGFTGLLYPLQGAMDALSRGGWEAGDLLQHKMQGTYRGLFATANSYAGMDNNNARNLSNLTAASIRAAKLAVDLINKALNKVIEIAARRLNAYGFAADLAASGVKWIASGFKFEGKDFPFWGDAIAIKNMISSAVKLYESIDQIAKAGQSYYQGIQQIYKTAQQVPDVDSSHEVVDTVEGFGAGAQQMREAQQNFNEGRKAFQQALGGMQRATPR